MLLTMPRGKLSQTLTIIMTAMQRSNSNITMMGSGIFHGDSNMAIPIGIIGMSIPILEVSLSICADAVIR